MLRRRLVLLAVLAVGAAAVPAGPGLPAAVAAPPTNDAFADAEVVAGASGSVAGTNVEATAEAGEPDHAGTKGGTSVWYRWTAPAGGLLELSTEGSDFDTALAVYTGTSVGALTEIGSGDDACHPAGACGADDRTSRAAVPVQAGVDYSIAVDGYGAATGTIALAWSHLDDTVPPSVALGRPGLSLYQTSTVVEVRWAGVDPSGLAGFDVDVRVFKWDGTDTGWKAWLAGTSATSASYQGTFGRSYCFRVRATDAVGNVSVFTQPGCVAVPLRSDHLTYSSTWLSSASSDAYGGQFMWTTSKGAMAIRANVRGERIAIVATKCPTCGSLRVYWNQTKMKDISLASSTTQRAVVIPLADWGWLRSGSVVIQVLSSSPRLAVIEGLAVYRD
jgi:hypothetical protein